jgi:hypothetical protein
MMSSLFFPGGHRDFREVADPEALWWKDTWYVYPSAGQAYVSRDLRNWEYCPIDIDGKLGYAPTIAKLGERFLLTSSPPYGESAAIYSAPAPLGRFENLGEPRDIHGNPLQAYLDPALFVDTDGRLYLYWGCGPDDGGIFGAEMDAENPIQAVSEVKKLFDFNPANKWERFGEYNEHDTSFVEGVSMFKHMDEYYLQYSACGAVFRNYAIGCYRGKSPLGPFYYQESSPIAHSTSGMVTGTGHGGMVEGPNGSVWLFYSCPVRRSHFFERRIGADRVFFDSEGNPHVNITSTPQSLENGDIGLLPVSVNKPVKVSSCHQFNYGNFAVDDCTHTWWEPGFEDTEPWLEVYLRQEFRVSAARIMWSESNLDYVSGTVPEPVKFKMEFFGANHEKLPYEVDFSDNNSDHIVEFVTFEPIAASIVRITILQGKDKIHHGISDFTVFGEPRR